MGLKKSELKKLNEIGKIIEKIKAKKEEERKIREKEEKAMQEEDKKFWEKEKKLYSKKKELYKKIIKWQDMFVKTKQFKELFDNDDKIIIFWNGWGHKNPRFCGKGFWSRLYLKKSGDLEYWAGYKWLGGGPQFLLNDKTIRN